MKKMGSKKRVLKCRGGKCVDLRKMIFDLLNHYMIKISRSHWERDGIKLSKDERKLSLRISKIATMTARLTSGKKADMTKGNQNVTSNVKSVSGMDIEKKEKEGNVLKESDKTGEVEEQVNVDKGCHSNGDSDRVDRPIFENKDSPFFIQVIN